MRRGRVRDRVAIGLAVGLVATALIACRQPQDRGGARVDRALHPSDPAGVAQFSLVLRLDTARIDGFLNEVADPRSPRFRHYLTPARFGHRFGISDRALALVKTHIRRMGFRILPRDNPQRTSLSIEGSVASIERSFHITLWDRIDAQGHVYRSPGEAPTIPPDLRPAVTAVSGLDTQPKTSGLQQGGDPTANLLRPNDIAKVWDIGPLWQQGIRGEGETVAIVAFGTFSQDDVKAFDQEMGIVGAPDVEAIPLGGATAYDPSDDGDGEYALDIQTVRAVAPMAKILDYEAADSKTFGDVIHAIVADARANIATISYGFCDVPESQWWSERQGDETEFAAAAATGVGLTVFASTGDSGAYPCQREDIGLDPAGAYPADSKHVVAVGGTTLTRAVDGSYLSEAGWENVLSQLGSGGGTNSVDAGRPCWQVAPGVPSSPPNRLFPDVAGPADPADADSQFYTVVTALDQNGKPAQFISPGSGTSQASPFWAGVWALMQEYARKHGAPITEPADQLLYRLAATQQPFPPFHDVTIGGNRLSDATPGWDLATGLGSPDAYNLARDIAAAEAHPQPRCDGGSGGA